MAAKRKAGWYWVLLTHGWIIAQLSVNNSNQFFACGVPVPLDRLDISEIGPRIEPPKTPCAGSECIITAKGRKYLQREARTRAFREKLLGLVSNERAAS